MQNYSYLGCPLVTIEEYLRMTLLREKQCPKVQIHFEARTMKSDMKKYLAPSFEIF